MLDYFRSVIFRTDDELLCQSRRGVFSIFIEKEYGRRTEQRMGTTMLVKSTSLNYEDSVHSDYNLEEQN